MFASASALCMGIEHVHHRASLITDVHAVVRLAFAGSGAVQQAHQRTRMNDDARVQSAGICSHSYVWLYVQGSLGWRLLFGVAVLPAAAVLVVVPWLYETPHR
jgi:hypothetical protein